MAKNVAPPPPWRHGRRSVFPILVDLSAEAMLRRFKHRHEMELLPPSHRSNRKCGPIAQIFVTFHHHRHDRGGGRRRRRNLPLLTTLLRTIHAVCFAWWSLSLCVCIPSCHGFHHRPSQQYYRHVNTRQKNFGHNAYNSKTTSSSSTEDNAAQRQQQERRDELIELGRRQLAPFFRFPLDDWQLEAGGAICNGWNVIVCAPTGAGKTVVGEMALYHAQQQQLRGIYTTPLKALSNQKYSDLIPLFGRNQVGLSTGDVSINKHHARVTVMTTEVYRNLAWRKDSSSSELDDTAVTVLDEFHYMGHPGRGGVWEESVITSPPHMQLVALSATLPNADQLAQWMEFVTQKSTILVQVTQQRPVPLRYLFATKDGLFPLFRDPDAGPGAPKGLLGLRGDGVPPSSTKTKSSKSSGFGGRGTNKRGSADDDEEIVDEKIPRGLQVNPALRAAAEKRLQRVNRALERQKAQAYFALDDNDSDLDWFRRSRTTPPSRMSPREERKERERLLRKELRRSVPSLPALVNRLDQKRLLPAIFFIFSRAGCEDAARILYQTMKGPRDPNRLLRDEADELRAFAAPSSATNREGQPKRKTRQRGYRQQRDNLIQDMDGRTFRYSGNYISEEALLSLYEPAEPIPDDTFDEYSPLSSENWGFYSSAGLLDFKQVKEVAARAARFNEENPEIAFDDEIVEQFLFGVGAHHAGMLPAHKTFVEVLYRNQLMKVVFATETLAAGINMPARTTVVCSLAKRGDGSSINLLETSNLLQMAGRAGRRGMDTDGTCVIVATPFETHDDAARILTDRVKPITSQFTPSYSLVVNLIGRGEGKLDVARQLIGKSFAKWERTSMEETMGAGPEGRGDAVSELVHASAQERFMLALAETLQVQVDRKRATFDISKLQKLLEIFNDRELLKKTSKSYVGAVRMLELEQTTLQYLEKELEATRALFKGEDDALLGDIVHDDVFELTEQIEAQARRAKITEKEVSKHPFTSIAKIANSIMSEATAEGTALRKLLQLARQGSEEPVESLDLTPDELSRYSKSAIVLQRKARKLAVGTDVKAETILDITRQVNSRDDSWENVLAITKTLLSYGCLSIDCAFSQDMDLEAQTYTFTPAGTNVAMLGFENSLWCVVAIGGAWDVISASARLDTYRASRSDEDDLDYKQPDRTISKPQEEAEALVSTLRSLSASELAGYISSLVSENSRSGGPSVVDLFQRLTPPQQRVVQSSLLVMDRLMEVQRLHSVDESTRTCTLDISNCEVVTAWAGGCTWTEALQISGLPPGDLARSLSRALDALRQLGNLPYTPVRHSDLSAPVSRGIHPDIRRLCREAVKGINRYPLKDTFAFEAGDEDDFDQEVLVEMDQTSSDDPPR